MTHLALQGHPGLHFHAWAGLKCLLPPKMWGCHGQCKALLLGWVPFPRVSRKSPLTSLAPDKAGQWPTLSWLILLPGKLSSLKPITAWQLC